MTSDALKQDLVYKSTLNHWPELNEENKCIQSSHVSSMSLSDIATARDGPTCDDLVIKMIEVKQVSDEVKVCYTGDALALERAFQCGLIPASVYVRILQRQKVHDDMNNPSSAENAPLLDSEQGSQPCEVNRLILDCLSRVF